MNRVATGEYDTDKLCLDFHVVHDSFILVDASKTIELRRISSPEVVEWSTRQYDSVQFRVMTSHCGSTLAVLSQESIHFLLLVDAQEIGMIEANLNTNSQYCDIYDAALSSDGMNFYSAHGVPEVKAVSVFPR